MLVVGGYGPVSSCELYDPQTGLWSPTGSSSLTPLTGWDVAAVALRDNRVLTYGQAGKQCELYNPSTGKWKPTGALIEPRGPYSSAALLPDGRVLSISGRHPNPAECQLYDPQSESWKTTSALIKLDGYLNAILLTNGTVIAIGYTYCQIFDPQTEQWRIAGKMNTPRGRYLATLLKNGEVLVAGGVTSFVNGDCVMSTEILSCELYDPSSNIWRTTGELDLGFDTRSTLTLLRTGDVLLLGYGLTNAFCRIYQTSSGKWYPHALPDTDHSEHTATMLTNGDVLITSGYNGGTACDILEYQHK